MRRFTLVVALALSTSSNIAIADDGYTFMRIAGDEEKDDGDGPLIPWDVSWDVGFGPAFGASQFGTKTFAQVGVDTGARLTIGRASLMAGYQTASTHRWLEDGELLQGRSHRFTAALGLEVHKFGRGLLSGETFVALGTGRQFVSWDQGTLSRRDVFVHVEQSMAFRFPTYREGIIRSPDQLLIGLWVQVIASRTPPFAIMPVSATRDDKSETDIGFLAGYVLRFRR